MTTETRTPRELVQDAFSEAADEIGPKVAAILEAKFATTPSGTELLRRAVERDARVALAEAQRDAWQADHDRLERAEARVTQLIEALRRQADGMPPSGVSFGEAPDPDPQVPKPPPLRFGGPVTVVRDPSEAAGLRVDAATMDQAHLIFPYGVTVADREARASVVLGTENWKLPTGPTMAIEDAMRTRAEYRDGHIVPTTETGKEPSDAAQEW